MATCKINSKLVTDILEIENSFVTEGLHRNFIICEAMPFNAASINCMCNQKFTKATDLMAFLLYGYWSDRQEFLYIRSADILPPETDALLEWLFNLHSLYIYHPKINICLCWL